MVRANTINRKNIWVAAGDGELDRVRELVEEGTSPNIPDPNTYTPMHAAASYGQLEVLDYLISKGGDVNITDEDNETPLFVVESIDAARRLIDNGAIPDWRNAEGVTPADNLEEDFPEVAAYLRSLSTPDRPVQAQPQTTQPSQFTTEQTSERLTSELLERAHTIMERADREGRDSEAELAEAVGQAVAQGMQLGQGWTSQSPGRADADASKRPRLDER